MRFIPCPIKKQAFKNASHPAIICNDAALTYKELDLAIDACAHKLRRIGVKKKDRICILNPASIEYIIALFALWRSGAVACLLSQRLPESACIQQIKSVQGKVLLTQSIKAYTHIPVRSVLLQHVVAKDVPSDAVKNPRYALAQPVTILFTSGSTYEPKAVQHSFGNHYYNALGSNENIPVGQNDRWLLSLPLYHVSGLSILFRCFLAGAVIVIPRENNELCSVIEAFRITHVSVVATQLQRALHTQWCVRALRKLKAILIGGSAVHEQLLEKARGEKLPVYLSYGLTEMASQVATTANLKNNGSSLKARVLRYRKVRIAGDGEILVAGKPLFQGYIHKGVLQAGLDTKGWFHTRDIGFLEDGKFLTVKARKDSMFISAGENIFPEEIEYHLRACALIEDAVVIPVSHPEYGLRPIAFIKQKKGSHINRLMLVKHLSQWLPKFKIPDAFYLWPKELSSSGINPDFAIVKSARRAARLNPMALAIGSQTTAFWLVGFNLARRGNPEQISNAKFEIKANRDFFRQLLQEKKKKLQLLA